MEVTESVQTITALLSMVAAATALLVAVSMVLARWGRAGGLRAGFADVGLVLATGVALVATAGSLYFSEIANYVPCNLCWYQRIAMYSVAVIGTVSLVRRDTAVAPYVVVLAVLGAGISAYHYVVEWNPQLETEVCSLEVPCTTIWFREFGFATLPFMALCGFAAIAMLSLVTMREHDHQGGSQDLANQDLGASR